MDLAKRDMLITNLKKLKKEKEQFLFDKKQRLNKQKDNNLYLNDVVNEYNEYFENIDKQHEKQINALQILANYMNTIISDPTTTEEIVKYAKYDHNIILSEIRQII